MWFIGVEVEQETSAPLLKKIPGSAPVNLLAINGAGLLCYPVFSGLNKTGNDI